MTWARRGGRSGCPRSSRATAIAARSSAAMARLPRTPRGATTKPARAACPSPPPDHTSIKSIAEYLRGVLEHDGVSFVGGVHLGEDVTREDLLANYDAVVYATGAMRDRRLGIPGEDLPGSVAATDFVNWYCGHPDVDPGAFSLDAESVAVIGVGNVAVDVARILSRNPRELRPTDGSQPVLDARMASKVPGLHMIRR